MSQLSHGAEQPAPSIARIRRKRADGEGTIYQRSDGLWVGELMVGNLPDGKRDVRRVTSKAQAEVRRKLQALKEAHGKGTLVAADKARDTVAGFITEWLDTMRSAVRPTTHKRYADLLRLHIVPALGTRPLTALRPADVQRLYGQLLQSGLAPRTVRHIHTVFHHVLADALKWESVARNVCDAVTPPRVQPLELQPPDGDDLARFLDAAGADRFLPLWTLAVYTGARQGELLGLRWQDIDLAASTITINRTLLQSSSASKPAYSPPKTARSRRTIAIPAVAVNALRELRKTQVTHKLALGPDYTDGDLVFATALGTPFLHSNVHRAFKLALQRAGLPTSIRFHDLRHGAATNMRAAGVDLKTVSERLGHSSIAITADVYTHGLKQADASAASSLAALIEGKRQHG